MRDAAGRAAVLPARIELVFPAGPPAAILLLTLAPDLLAGWPARPPGPAEAAFLTPGAAAPPEIGQLTGRDNTANLEAVVALRPGLVLDYGATGPTYASLADRVREQTGIPTLLLDGVLARIPETYRLLGAILDREEAALRANAAGRILDDARAAAAILAGRGRPRVLYLRGPRGEQTGLAGSINTEIIEFSGAENVAAAALGSGGLTPVSPEQALAWDPDWVLAQHPGFPRPRPRGPGLARPTRGAGRAAGPGAGTTLRVGGLPAVGGPAARTAVAAGAVRLPAGRRVGRGGSRLPRVVLRPPARAGANRGAAAPGAACPDVTEAAPARAAPAWAAWTLATLLLLLAVLAALVVGRFPIAPAELPAILLGRADEPAAAVFWNIRLPRVLAATLVGASLATAGAAFQGMFRNALASPDLLGVSAGASLGAVAGIVFGLPVVAIQGLAFAGGVGAVAAVAALGAAVRGQGDPTLVLVLAGIALGTLLGAAISLLKVLADPYNQLPAITFWLLGSLSAVNRADVAAAAGPALAGLALLLRWRLNLLALGEDEARSLGVTTGPLRVAAVAAATLATAAVNTLAGGVGWVGLVVPHAARLLGGPDLRQLVPLSMLLGAAFLLAVDTLARGAGRLEVPLGILTALLGTPLFLWLLAGARRGERT